MKLVRLAAWVVVCLGSMFRGDSFAQFAGSSYVYIIPYVTSENNTRTNLGLNGYILESLVKGANPSAKVQVDLFDQQGKLGASANYTVKPNQLVQVNNIISALGSNIGTGWLVISSDEPITAWASVILSSTNDPSIELAIDLQGRKPTAYVEGIARGEDPTRLLIESSVKTDTFASSLVVVNINNSSGTFTIETYDKDGNLLGSKPVNIGPSGMYVDNDIRSSFPGTFGEIVITPAKGSNLRLVANSLVKSVSGTGAFFPAFTLPNAGYSSMAGIWNGTVTGTLMNGQIRLELHQEREMFYGLLRILNGSFPTTTKAFPIYGQANGDEPGALQNTSIKDTDAAGTIFSLRIIGDIDSTLALKGKIYYADANGRVETASFTTTRTGSIF